jgi:hypothetical protein
MKSLIGRGVGVSFWLRFGGAFSCFVGTLYLISPTIRNDEAADRSGPIAQDFREFRQERQ